MKKITLISLLALLIWSCTKDKDPGLTTFDPVNNQSEKPDGYYQSGLGTNQGVPAGTVFSLPAGLEIVGNIQGGYPSFLNVQPTANKEKMQFDNTAFSIKTSSVQIGIGTFVNVYFDVLNTTPADINLVLPGGLVMPYAHHNSNYQSGFLVQNAEALIPAGDTVEVMLKSFCLNRSYHPADSSAHYMLGILTSNPELLQVVSILQNKQPVTGHESDIQSILWHITDDGGLQAADTVLLNSLP